MATTPRREEILKAASIVIAERGFAGATVREIARASNMLSGSLYHHFASKDQMLLEILTAMISDIEQSYIKIVAKGDTPTETLRSLLITGFELLNSWQVEIRILQNDYSFLLETSEFDFLIQAQDDIAAVWIDQIERGIKKKEFRSEIPSALLYRMMMGSVLNAARWFVSGARFSASEIGKMHADLFLNGLLKAK